jgi:hypothetical protein
MAGCRWPDQSRDRQRRSQAVAVRQYHGLTMAPHTRLSAFLDLWAPAGNRPRHGELGSKSAPFCDCPLLTIAAYAPLGAPTILNTGLPATLARVAVGQQLLNPMLRADDRLLRLCVGVRPGG